MRTAFPGYVNPIYQNQAIEVDIKFYMKHPLSHFVNRGRSNDLKAKHSFGYTPHWARSKISATIFCEKRYFGKK